MVVSKSCTYVSPEDYLAGEKISPIKHEYRQGEIYAMAGASKAHVIIRKLGLKPRPYRTALIVKLCCNAKYLVPSRVA